MFGGSWAAGLGGCGTAALLSAVGCVWSPGSVVLAGVGQAAPPLHLLSCDIGKAGAVYSVHTALRSRARRSLPHPQHPSHSPLGTARAAAR